MSLIAPPSTVADVLHFSLNPIIRRALSHISLSLNWYKVATRLTHLLKPRDLLKHADRQAPEWFEA